MIYSGGALSDRDAPCVESLMCVRLCVTYVGDALSDRDAPYVESLMSFRFCDFCCMRAV